MATDLTKIINYNDPNFQSKYSKGVSIYNADEDTRYYYDPNTKTLTPYSLDAKHHDPYIDSGVEQIQYSQSSGLAANVGSQSAKSMWNFINKEAAPGYQKALTNNFGLGPTRTPEEIANNAAVLAQVRGEQAGTRTAPNATNAANPTVQAAAVDYGRKLGPTEFTGLAREWGQSGLTSAEIEKYYLNRDANGNIYLKSGALPSANEIIGMRPGAKSGTIDMGGGATAEATVVPKSDLSNIQYNVEDKSGLYARAGVTSPFDQYIADVQAQIAQAQTNAGVQDKLTKLTTLQTEAAKMKTAIENESIFNLQEIEQASGALAPMSTIRLRQSNISRDQQFEMMIAQNEYNGKLQEIAIMGENYNKAVELAKDSADLYKEVALAKLQYNLDLSKEQRANAEKAIEYQRDLALKGYVDLSTIPQSSWPSADKIYTDPVTGKKYLKPSEAEDTQVVEVNGRKLLINSKTGATIQDLGAAEINIGGLSEKDRTTFLNISNKYQSDSIISTATTASMASNIANQVEKDPSKAGDQISLLYSYIKLLDPSSAVREGEIGLAQQTQSYLSKFQTSLERISQGKPISESAALELARATKGLAEQWSTIASRREQQYQSQADTAGVGEYWKQYKGGFTNVYQSINGGNDPMNLFDSGGGGGDPLGLGFNNVGGDTETIAEAIKAVESGGNYTAKGASGEYGAYQFMPATWKDWAGKYLGKADAPMTPANQDKVAKARIDDLLKQGYNAYQIALIWNGGSPTIKSGTNKYGVKYDTGAYANKIINELKKYG